MSAAADDDMVVKRDADRGGRVFDFTRHLDIRARGLTRAQMYPTPHDLGGRHFKMYIRGPFDSRRPANQATQPGKPMSTYKEFIAICQERRFSNR
jgi:hypothetical protein